MTKIYLTRHGQDEDNEKGILNGHRDMPLTDIGLSQADEVSQKIEEAGITQLVECKLPKLDAAGSSPVARSI